MKKYIVTEDQINVTGDVLFHAADVVVVVPNSKFANIVYAICGSVSGAINARYLRELDEEKETE